MCRAYSPLHRDPSIWAASRFLIKIKEAVAHIAVFIRSDYGIKGINGFICIPESVVAVKGTIVDLAVGRAVMLLRVVFIIFAHISREEKHSVKAAVKGLFDLFFGLDLYSVKNFFPFFDCRRFNIVVGLSVKLFQVLSGLLGAYKGCGDSHFKIVGSTAKGNVGKNIVGKSFLYRIEPLTMVGIKGCIFNIDFFIEGDCKINPEILGHLVKMVAHLSGNNSIVVYRNLGSAKKL